MSGHTEKTVDELIAAAKRIRSDTKLSPWERRRLMKPIVSSARVRRDDLNRKVADNIAEVRRLDLEMARLKAQSAAVDDLGVWAQGSLALERNDCSRAHKIAEAIYANRLIGVAGLKDLQPEELSELLLAEHTFVVKHDWAKAFDGAEGLEAAEFAIPFEYCMFEFRISGRSVTAVAFQEEGSDEISVATLVECSNDWWFASSPEVADGPLNEFIKAQIKAICIALDTEVAARSTVDAPGKLNKKRAANGKPPVMSYHVVDLARRIAKHAPAGDPVAGARKRLHFRRGHWRHYEDRKTWIRWTLVGDPNLGFIAKDYSL